MASSFDRWEKDSFFSAAEEVQESADRVESTYRTWVHAKKDASSIWNCEELGRDLRTALGTTKWQLEEFERAVEASYVNNSNDDARDRHREFILAIGDQISKTQCSVQELSQSKGKSSRPWMQLDEGESEELAMFLSGPSAGENKTAVNNVVSNNEKPHGMDEESALDCSINSHQPVEQGSHDDREEKSHGHRRAASASPDIGSWKIAISGVDFQQCPLNGQTQKLVRKIPSFSGFLNTVESASKFKWPKNGFRKLKVVDRHQETNSKLQSPQSARGIIVGYERNKSCLDSCDDFYDKQLYGWYGSIQRQFQRSIYQMQYSRPVQVTLLTVVIISLDMIPREVVFLLKGLSLLMELQARQILVKVIRVDEAVKSVYYFLQRPKPVFLDTTNVFYFY
uniref:Syntaxin 6/10/61 N-terminal domain-containing protein n=1 Tax=Cucumis melo TaxID=3656 RepID=A0A9I9CZK9_CUCME